MLLATDIHTFESRLGIFSLHIPTNKTELMLKTVGNSTTLCSLPWEISCPQWANMLFWSYILQGTWFHPTNTRNGKMWGRGLEIRRFEKEKEKKNLWRILVPETLPWLLEEIKEGRQIALLGTPLGVHTMVQSDHFSFLEARQITERPIW